MITIRWYLRHCVMYSKNWFPPAGFTAEPYLVQTTYSGFNLAPHWQQNFLCPNGFAPQDIQATACAETELPQLVQNWLAGGGAMGGTGTFWVNGGGGATVANFNPCICPASPVCPPSVARGVVAWWVPGLPIPEVLLWCTDLVSHRFRRYRKILPCSFSEEEEICQERQRETLKRNGSGMPNRSGSNPSDQRGASLTW